jgi:photosystem II stability/assembly factor-like uncharacterized protein
MLYEGYFWNRLTIVPGWAFWDSGQMLWTMAMKDYIAETQDNRNVTDAISLIRQGNMNFQSYEFCWHNLNLH